MERRLLVDRYCPSVGEDLERGESMIQLDGDVLGDAGLDESGPDDFNNGGLLGDQGFSPGLEHHLGTQIWVV